MSGVSKKIVLAEKPSVARDIAKVLRCNKKGNGYLEGDHYIVTWALGHLVTLADPEYYDKKYQQWELQTLPMLPEQIQTVVIKQTSKQYHAVVTQLRRKDVTGIIIATDAGREGELVARFILRQAKINKPIERLWISSVTDKAIQDGFRRLQPGKKYEALYQSGFARAMADWYVGMNATRALTTKYNAQLSAGRVQTPTLALIALRESQISTFQPKTFDIVSAKYEDIQFTWEDARSGATQIFATEQTSMLLQKITGKPLEIKDVKIAKKQTPAPLLYDLTELQRDANQRYGFSAKETLKYLQSLYEHHKVVTYPRTDSRYLSQDIVPTFKERLLQLQHGNYGQVVRKLLAKPLKMSRKQIDDSKVSDHHAIIPTEAKVNTAAMSNQEKQVYDLIVGRFLASLLPDYVYEKTTIEAVVEGEQFKTSGNRTIDEGWKIIKNPNQETEGNEPVIKQKFVKGQQLSAVTYQKKQGQTKPPSFFTEATLLSAMEHPAKFMGNLDAQTKKRLEQTNGLGTVATRADIIEKLFSSFSIEKKGQEIHLTAKGKQLLDLVPQELQSPVLTAQWEEKLKQIAEQKLAMQQFVEEIKTYTKEVVKDIKNDQKTFKHQNISAKTCPTCGKPMLEVNGKKGKLLVCSDRLCKTKQSVSVVTNARCPQCHKKLSLFGQGEGRIFVCGCGYREKLSSFEKRKQQEQNGKAASKREVEQFLRKNQQQEKAPSAFASAFAKLKVDKE